MASKPEQFAPEFGAQFSDPSVADVYHLRPPYPLETFDVLSRLVVDRPRTVLDVGTGTGEIARLMLEHVDRIDAVDPSAAMIARGGQLPGGDSDKLNWINETAESATLEPPYALITAGASLHWMEWSVVLPLFRDSLTPHGVLAIVTDVTAAPPWKEPLGAICQRYSTNHRFRPYNVVTEIQGRGLFQPRGHHQTTTLPFTQSVNDYVASFHARNGFSRDRMTPDAANAFDREVGDLVSSYASDGTVTLHVSTDIVWGNPAPNGMGSSS